MFEVKEIKKVEDLEVGKFYYLYEKQTSNYIGCLKLEQIEGQELFINNTRWWASKENDQITSRCYIFGPVKLETSPTLEELRKVSSISKVEVSYEETAKVANKLYCQLKNFDLDYNALEEIYDGQLVKFLEKILSEVGLGRIKTTLSEKHVLINAYNQLEKKGYIGKGY